MRNLILYQLHTEDLNLHNTPEPLLSLIDEMNHLLIVLTRDMKVIIISYQQHKKSNILHEIELEGNISGDTALYIMNEIESGFNPFIYWTYKPEIESVVIVLNTGEMLTVNLSAVDAKSTKLIKDLQQDDKIIKMETSANQEYVVVVTSKYKLILLSYDNYGCLGECDLDDGDTTSTDSTLSECSISFKQNGDLFCVLYKINNGFKCWVRDTKMKIIKGPARADNKIVFSTAEGSCDYLSNVVAFQPNGSLIAYYDNKNKKIIFTEKNCLIHGHCNIIETRAINPILLKWNFDSPMLLFVYECESKYYLHIYYRSNYEWSLKYQSIKDIKVSHAQFSDISVNELLVYYSNNRFEIYNFVFEYTSSVRYGNNYSISKGEIVVNNNVSVLKYSPLGMVNIPPPMSWVNIKDDKGSKFFWFKNLFFSMGENSITVYKSNQRNFEALSTLSWDTSLDWNNVKKVIFVPQYHRSKGFVVINSVNTNNWNSEEIDIFVYDILYSAQENQTVIEFSNTQPSRHLHKEWSGFNRGIIYSSVLFEKNYQNDYYKISDSKAKSKEQVPVKMDLDMLDLDHMNEGSSSNVNNIHEKDNSDDGFVYFYLAANNVTSNEIEFYKFTINLSTYSTTHDIYLNQTHNTNDKITSITTCLVATKTNLVTSLEEVTVYLTHNNKLFQNAKLLSNDINSFIVFNHFLWFTQISSTPYSSLHIVDLSSTSETVFDPEQYKQNLNYKNYKMRTIERGAQIVTCSYVNVILQMPRGNLETISPRLMLWNEIENSVDKEDYFTAFTLCRKHKINWNYIIDWNTQKFISNIQKFVEKVDNVDYINLFINSWDNAVCEEYQIIKAGNNMNNASLEVNKVNVVCKTWRDVITRLNKDNIYLHSIWISYIKQSPPMYWEALKLVQKWKIENNNDKAEKALSFWCWIVKAETWFDFSLKTYDFELVIMCAKYTQKDPKEYLSYWHSLEEIKKTDEILMKYQINLDQKCYTDALIELSKGGEKYFDKCIKWMSEHLWFDLGLSLFNKPIYEDLYMKICNCKGDYYSKSAKQPQRAAVYYLRGKNYEQAIKCYLDIGKVNEVLGWITVNPKLDISLFETVSTWLDKCNSTELEKIFTFIITNNNYERFTKDELSNLSMSIIGLSLQNKIYLSTYFMSMTLMKLLSQSNNKEYASIALDISKKLHSEIELKYDWEYNTLNKNWILFKEKYDRLLKVQELKREHPELFIIDVSKNETEWDNVSDSGSVRSKSNKSSSSRASRKTKMKKVKQNIKEGSIMEEENIMMIWKGIKLEDKENEIISEFIELMLMCKYTDKAVELENLKNWYVKTVNEKLKKTHWVDQVKFLNEHPELKDLFPEITAEFYGSSNSNNNNTNTKKERK